MSSINEQIDVLKRNVEKEIKESYDKGYIDGILKCHALDGVKTPLDNVEYRAIKDFAKWCYVHGIDFSYMSSGHEAKPFVERVLDKYEEDRKKVVE